MNAESDIRLTVDPPFQRDVLALGGQLKNTVCAATGDRAFVSAPHGDLTHPDAYRQFVSTVDRLEMTLDHSRLCIAHDLHPSYLSTVCARSRRHPPVAVQHHHAHAISCAVDAGVPFPVVGIVCDGAGYGTDDAVWGGEVLLCTTDSFERVAHLDYFPLPGGDLAAQATWRPAVALLRSTFPHEWERLDLPPLGAIDPREWQLVARQMETGLNAPDTSSLGRLFDAVAFLAGVCGSNTYEGQAAIELQAAAGEGGGAAYPFAMDDETDPIPIDWRPMIKGIVDDVRGGVGVATIAARFHETVAHMFAAAAVGAARRTGVRRVVLSGGCFHNGILRTSLTGRLEEGGLTVAQHRSLSPGDAGLSLGQALIASDLASKMDH
jgi:hydrogenase maturation protein HypF